MTNDPWKLATVEDIKVDSHLFGVFGPPGSGKTFLTQTKPGPKAYFPYVPENWRGTTEKGLDRGEEMYIFPFTCAATPILHGTDEPDFENAIKRNKELGHASYAGFSKNYTRALTDPSLNISSIIIDTASALLQVGMFANYGTLQVWPEKNWGSIKTWWRSFIESHANARSLAMAEGRSCPDVVLITQEKPEYVNDSATDNVVWGCKADDVGYLETVIHTDTEVRVNPETGEGITAYTAELIKPRHLDLKVDNPTWTSFHDMWKFKEFQLMQKIKGGSA
jgi:hypothetical protein